LVGKKKKSQRLEGARPKASPLRGEAATRRDAARLGIQPMQQSGRLLCSEPVYCSCTAQARQIDVVLAILSAAIRARLWSAVLVCCCRCLKARSAPAERRCRARMDPSCIIDRPTDLMHLGSRSLQTTVLVVRCW